MTVNTVLAPSRRHGDTPAGRQACQYCGIFKKYCLEAKMTQFPSGPAALAASLQGGLDFISLAPDTVYVPASQGFDLKIVAFMNDTVHYVLVVGKDVPLPHKSEGYPGVMKDLVGKKIGCWVLLRQPSRRQAGVFKDAVEFRNTTGSSKLKALRCASPAGPLTVFGRIEVLPIRASRCSATPSA